MVGSSVHTPVLSGQFASSNSASTHCHAALQIPRDGHGCRGGLRRVRQTHPCKSDDRDESNGGWSTSQDWYSILHPSEGCSIDVTRGSLSHHSLTQKGGGGRRLCRRLATRRSSQVWRGGKGAAVRAGRLSGHWPDPASSAPATPGLAGPGSPGRMPGPWRGSRNSLRPPPPFSRTRQSPQPHIAPPLRRAVLAPAPPPAIREKRAAPHPLTRLIN